MTQKSRPQLDQVLGGWTNEDDTTDPMLALSIDETVASDADFAQSSLAPSEDAYVVQLSSLTDPGVSSGHTVSFRFKKEAGNTLNLLVELRQGYVDEDDQGTLIRSELYEDIADSFTDETFTLTGGEANAIGDYQNLSLRFVANQDPPPTDPDLIMWIEASAIEGVDDGDPIDSAPDLSGNGNDAEEAGDVRPIYTADGINGLPVMRCYGWTGDDTQGLTAPEIPAAPQTVLMVVRGDPSWFGGSSAFVFLDDSVGVRVDSGSDPWYAFGATDIILADVTASDGDPHLLTTVARDFDDIDVITDDGAPTNDADTDWFDDTLGATYIGYPSDLIATDFVDIAACIVTASVDPDVIAAWQTYLLTRYAI